MQLLTPVNVPAPLRPFDANQRYVFMGSCFAQHIGRRFAEADMQVCVNPLGPIYSPYVLSRAIEGWGDVHAVSGPQGWHTWVTDTSFTRPTAEEAERLAALSVETLGKSLADADHLILTFGTNHHYELLSTGRVVSNCHKHPQKEFRECVLPLPRLADRMSASLDRLFQRNPRIVVTLPVSPYRYQKYGLHENQLSKATLLLLADGLQQRFPEQIQYFPAYEILQDELRDYRFYAPDMLHPNDQAVQYIQERLQLWMTPALQDYLLQYERLRRFLLHRPFDATDATYRAQVVQTHEQLSALRRQYVKPNV